MALDVYAVDLFICVCLSCVFLADNVFILCVFGLQCYYGWCVYLWLFCLCSYGWFHLFLFANGMVDLIVCYFLMVCLIWLLAFVNGVISLCISVVDLPVFYLRCCIHWWHGICVYLCMFALVWLCWCVCFVLFIPRRHCWMTVQLLGLLVGRLRCFPRQRRGQLADSLAASRLQNGTRSRVASIPRQQIQTPVTVYSNTVS